MQAKLNRYNQIKLDYINLRKQNSLSTDLTFQPPEYTAQHGGSLVTKYGVELDKNPTCFSAEKIRSVSFNPVTTDLAITMQRDDGTDEVLRPLIEMYYGNPRITQSSLGSIYFYHGFVVKLETRESIGDTNTDAEATAILARNQTDCVKGAHQCIPGIIGTYVIDCNYMWQGKSHQITLMKRLDNSLRNLNCIPFVERFASDKSDYRMADESLSTLLSTVSIKFGICKLFSFVVGILYFLNAAVIDAKLENIFGTAANPATDGTAVIGDLGSIFKFGQTNGNSTWPPPRFASGSQIAYLDMHVTFDSGVYEMLTIFLHLFADSNFLGMSQHSTGRNLIWSRVDYLPSHEIVSHLIATTNSIIGDLNTKLNAVTTELHYMPFQCNNLFTGWYNIDMTSGFSTTTPDHKEKFKLLIKIFALCCVYEYVCKYMLYKSVSIEMMFDKIANDIKFYIESIIKYNLYSKTIDIPPTAEMFEYVAPVFGPFFNSLLTIFSNGYEEFVKNIDQRLKFAPACKIATLPPPVALPPPIQVLHVPSPVLPPASPTVACKRSPLPACKRKSPQP